MHQIPKGIEQFQIQNQPDGSCRQQAVISPIGSSQPLLVSAQRNSRCKGEIDEEADSQSDAGPDVHCNLGLSGLR
jgi:hypothetical protein